MTVPVIAFFNNKGGVGKTSLVYHTAWAFADLGLPVLAADLDPQANLTAAFLHETDLEELWAGNGETIYTAVDPLLSGSGALREIAARAITHRVHLLPGDLRLSRYEDELTQAWRAASDRQARGFRVMGALSQIAQSAATRAGASVILYDLGPNLGALNRAAMVGVDFIVVPTAADLFSLQGLINLGPTLRDWRRDWQERRDKAPDEVRPVPDGAMKPVGYVVIQYAVRDAQPVAAYTRWIDKIPETYRQFVDSAATETSGQIGLLKHYRSLMPLAQTARKPIFHLRAADGAIGAHYTAVQKARAEFYDLAREIARRSGVEVPRGEP